MLLIVIDLIIPILFGLLKVVYSIYFILKSNTNLEDKSANTVAYIPDFNGNRVAHYKKAVTIASLTSGLFCP